MKRKICFITSLSLWIVIHGIYIFNNKQEKSINIGLLHSFNGTLSQNEMPIYLAAKLAVDEININGGIMGRELKMTVADGMSTADTFAHNAKALIQGSGLKEIDKKRKKKFSPVSAIFGTWTSSSRRNVIPVIEEYENLLFYSVQYEGVEGFNDSQKGNVIYMGACANQQLKPAIRWARLHLGKNAYFIGSNYIYPRIAYRLADKILKDENKAYISSARFVNLNKKKPEDFRDAIEDIRKTKPDYIINTLNGMDNNIAFFQALAQANLPKTLNVISFSITENDIKSIYDNIPNEFKVNNYLCWNYFSDLDSYQNLNFKNKVKNIIAKAKNNKDLPENLLQLIKEYQKQSTLSISEPMVDTYNAIHLWARVCEKIKSTDPLLVRKALLGSIYNGPGGVTYIDSKNGHSWKTLRIAKVDREEIKIIWNSIGPIQPEPFYGHTREEWNEILAELKNEFEGNWESNTAEDVSIFNNLSLLMTK